jgi:hypothetical protein
MSIAFEPPRGAAPASARGRPDAAYALRRVVTREDWVLAGAVRLASAANHDEAPASLLAMDGPEATAGCATFLLTRNGRPIGTTRTRHARAGEPFPLPSLQAFARDLHAGFGEATVVEASQTLVDAALADRAAALVHLFKAHMLTCAVQGAEWLVAAVPETRIGFHRRVFDMEILSGAEHITGAASPRVLMGLRYRERADRLARRLPVLAFDADDEKRFAATGEVRFEEAEGTGVRP